MRKVVWAGLICIAVIAMLGTYAVLASNVLHGPVNAHSLYLSVKNESGGDSIITDGIHTRCRHLRSPRQWACTVDDPTVSAGGLDYRVNVHPGSSCWDGAAGGRSPGLRSRISGCVHLREE
jgi:hypothetical protein